MAPIEGPAGGSENLIVRPKVQLSEVCEFTSGNGFRPSEWSREGLPIIRIQNLNGSREFNYYSGVPEESWIVRPGTLLYAWAGVKGVSFGPTIWDGPVGVLNQHIFRVEPKIEVDIYWLHSALQLVTADIEARAHGFKSSLVHVHKGDIINRFVELPTISEQRIIAKKLITWDGAIRTLGALAATKQRFFEDVRTILYREDGSENVFRFGEILRESRIPGGTGASSNKITLKLYGKGMKPKEEKREGSKTTQYFCRNAGQLIYSKLDFLNGAFGIVPKHLDGFQTTLDLPAFDIVDRVNPVWLLHYLIRPAYYSKQHHLARGQRVARRVNQSEFLASEIPIPTREQQDLVADTLSLAARDVELTEAELMTMRRQKRGLIRELNGKGWNSEL